MDVLKILIFSKPWAGYIFSFICVIFNINISQFSKYRYFTSLVKFITRNFILFDAIVNEIVSLISLSNILLLVYIKATDFYILILYLTTLVNSFIFFFLFIYFFLRFLYWLIDCYVGSSFLCYGFLQLWQVGATLHRGARASHYCGLSCCGAQAPDAQAQ